ncbi:MAG TPA: methyltransferase domain-containing protein [Methylomirabilota bacterium]|nr:methyltransferase domain-containing protein [Methylomirabilota bacterium]
MGEHSVHARRLQHGGSRGRYGNPADLRAYLARLEGASREAWQRPGLVVRALGLRAGQTVADIGGGPGYFSLRLARAVGPRGRVYAVEVEPRILEVLIRRLRRSPSRNVTPVLALPDDPLLPASSCDLVLLVNAYHHFSDGPAYLRRLLRALKPRGRLVNIDFHKRDTPVGPPTRHRVSREKFLSDARRAGLTPVGEQAFLPYQYFLILGPR